MTRKHYIAIAEALRPYVKEADQLQARQMRDVMPNLVCDIANMLKRDNSRFDRLKFYEACGYSFDDAVDIAVDMAVSDERNERW